MTTTNYKSTLKYWKNGPTTGVCASTPYNAYVYAMTKKYKSAGSTTLTTMHTLEQV